MISVYYSQTCFGKRVLPNRLSATVLNTFMCLYCEKKLRKIQTEIDRVLYPDKLSVMLSVTLEYIDLVSDILVFLESNTYTYILNAYLDTYYVFKSRNSFLFSYFLFLNILNICRYSKLMIYLVLVT